MLRIVSGRLGVPFTWPIACSGEKKVEHSSLRRSVEDVPVYSSTMDELPWGLRFCLTLLPKNGTMLLCVNSSARTVWPLSVAMRWGVVVVVGG